MSFNLRKYEDQARLSVLLAIVALIAVAGAAVVMAKIYSADVSGFPVKVNGKRFLAILGALGAALALGGAGFLVGFGSAGHKRNTKSRLSWTGFFMSAGAVTLAGSLLVIFWLMRFEV